MPRLKIFFIFSVISSIDIKLEGTDDIEIETEKAQTQKVEYEKIEIVKTQRGGECALHDGRRYYYKKKMKKNKNVHWRCVFTRNKTCSGSMVTNDDRVVKVQNHSCVPNYIENEKLKIVNRCVAVIDPHIASVSVLHKEIIQEFKNASLDINGEVPSKKVVFRKLSKSKQKMNKLNDIA